MEEGIFNIVLFARLRNFKFCRLSILSGTDVMRLSERSSISNVLMVTIISGSCSEFQVEVHFWTISRILEGNCWTCPRFCALMQKLRIYILKPVLNEIQIYV